MKPDRTVEELQTLIAPQVERMGYELWGLVCRLGPRRGQLCVYIDHPDGISHADCAAVSEQVGGLLDVADQIRTAYRLEVSSPGLDRLLLRPEHFARYRSARVALRLRWPLDGRRRLTGTIGAADADAVKLVEREEEYVVPYRAIAQARLQAAAEAE